MVLKGKLAEDLKRAMKFGDADRVGLLRLLQSAIHNKEIEKRTREKVSKDVELTDEELLQLLQTEVKKRWEAIEIFKKGGREDLASKEEKEAAIIMEYLPKQMSAEETETAVSRILKDSGAKDFGSAMKMVMAELRGKADAKAIAEIIKRSLSN